MEIVVKSDLKLNPVPKVLSKLYEHSIVALGEPETKIQDGSLFIGSFNQISLTAF